MRARLDRQRGMWMSTKVTRLALLYAVCAEFGAHVDDVTGPSRQLEWMAPRRAFAVLAKRCLHASLPETGRTLGGRDHTTALHALRRGLEREAIDPDFAAALTRIAVSCWPTPESGLAA